MPQTSNRSKESLASNWKPWLETWLGKGVERKGDKAEGGQKDMNKQGITTLNKWLEICLMFR